MSKKDDFKIDLMSSIDDDIIDKHTKKRFELLSGKKPRRSRKALAAVIALAACLAMLASFLVVILPMIPTGQIPVYQGMTVSNVAPEPESASVRPFSNNKAITLLGKNQGNNGNGNNRRPVVDIVKDSLSVDGTSEYLYYSRPNEDIYITVHIHNPDEYEILSFTLNGVKYSSYMFEAGSDLENLILKVNVGDAKGIVEYTIDAIKYVEGTQIKDVIMDGDKTVSVAVTPDAPTAGVTDVAVGFDSLSFNVSLLDENGLVDVSGEDYFAVICDGDSIVSKQNIGSKDESAVRITGLDPLTSYRYAIIGVYDGIDGEGKCVHVLYEDEVTTEHIVNVSDSYIEGADVCFDIAWNESYTGERVINSVELYDGETKIEDLDVAADRISNLPFDKEFTLVLSYTVGVKQYELYKTVYSPKSSVGLEMNYGVVVGEGSCADTVLYISAPVADEAFRGNSHIKEVYLSGDAQTVGEFAFGECSALEIVGMSKGIESIGSAAFVDCINLEMVKLPLGITCIEDFTFEGCEKLTSITIPEGVTTVGKSAFEGCEKFTSITIPEGVTTVGKSAFDGCSSLVRVDIPASLEFFDEGAFADCFSLEAVYISDLKGWCEVSFASATSSPIVYAGNLYLDGELLTVLEIPDGITKIDPLAFMGCASIEQVVGADALAEPIHWDEILCELWISSGNWITHGSQDQPITAQKANEDGLSFMSMYGPPYLRFATANKVDLKDGVYMEIRIDEFNYSDNIDSWFDVMFWDQQYMLPGSTEYGEGVQFLARPGIDNGTSWFLREFDMVYNDANNSGACHIPAVVDENGKHTLKIELSWDEASDTFVYTVNGVAAPTAIIDYMNEKWGGQDSEAYVGFCFHHTLFGEKIKCTLLKFGTDAESATVPQ